MINGSKILIISALTLAGTVGCQSRGKAKHAMAVTESIDPAKSSEAVVEAAPPVSSPPVAAAAASVARPTVVARLKPSGTVPGLFLMERIEIPSVIAYSGDVAPAEGEKLKTPKFKVARLRPRRESAELAIGETFQNRYLLDSHTVETAEGAGDAVLAIRDTVTSQLIILPFQEEVAAPKRFADFEYRGESTTRFQKGEGDVFKLPGDKKSEYQLVSFDDVGAIVRKIGSDGLLRVSAPTAPAPTPPQVLPEE